MLHRKWIGSALLVLVLISTGCGSAPPPTPAPVPTPAPSSKPMAVPKSGGALVSLVKAGEWQGSGDGGFTISFAVDPDGSTITQGLRVTFNATCGTRVQQVMEGIGTAEPISFKAGEMKYGDPTYTLVARAVAPDRIEGTLKVTTFTIGKMGECSAGEIPWSAVPK